VGGGSIVFVSHDMNAVKTLCDMAIMIDQGRMIDYGEPKDVVDFYQNMILKKMHQGDVPVEIKKVKKDISKNEISDQSSGISTNQVELVSIDIFDNFDRKISYIESGARVKIVGKILAHTDLKDPHYGIVIRNKLGSEVYGISTESMNIITSPHYNGKIITIICSLDLPLAPGDYAIGMGVGNGKISTGIFKEYCLFLLDVIMVKVIQNSSNVRFAGIVNLDGHLEIF
jgi:lipopolysaccharide transport system ATP-binding protein